MLYMTVAKASERWGVSFRQVQRLLAENRIPGAQKHGRAWMIPSDTEKPADPRLEKKPPQSRLSADLSRVIADTCAPLPAHNPDAILDAAREERARLQYAAELAYLRGDFTQAIKLFYKTQGDDAARLRACPVAVAAAISQGDYYTYTQIDEYLKGYIQADKGSDATILAELALATAAVSVIAPNMAPEWLKEGNFSAIWPQLRTFALYLRAKYFFCTGRHEAMLALSQTALALGEPEGGLSHTGLYLRLCCAMACHALERGDEARRYLLEAMRLALPHGLITPFAESVTALGGLTEECLEREFPALRDIVLRQWERTFQNWTVFHNQFTKDHLTFVLTLREYHIAQMVARHVPYAKIAKQLYISEGRLRNIMQEIYQKLFISGRNELVKYVF